MKYLDFNIFQTLVDIVLELYLTLHLRSLSRVFIGRQRTITLTASAGMLLTVEDPM